MAISSKAGEQSMAKADLIKKIVAAHINGDEARFRETVEAIIRDEQRIGHSLLAEDLHTLLQRAVQRQGNVPPTHLTFLPGYGRQGTPPTPSLVDILHPETHFSDLILSPETEKRIARVIDEHRQSKKLAAYHLKPKQRLLFVGPPGCGKTYTAGMLAAELGLPLIYVRVDAVLSSYLGETSSNLRKVFEYSTEQACVLLFDEFDSVGADRGNPQEVGELRRVVNSFLQLLDSWTGQGLIIAATNYEALLDNALWRRFEDVIAFDLPTPARIASYLRLLVRGVSKAEDFEPSSLAVKMEGLSFSQIRDVIIEAIKTMVLQGETRLRESHITDELKTSSWRISQKLIKRHVRLE